MSERLQFNPDNYEIKTLELDGEAVTYRAFERLEYCEHPVDEIQKLNLFVPEKLFTEEVNGYTLKSAPIFIPNSVGGYMEGPLDEPGRNFLGIPNAIFKALIHGYVVVAPGIRGRNTGMATNEFFVGSNAQEEKHEQGRLVGRAPALVVDMKAVIRYLRHNKAVIYGNTERIITSGTSAGGALSSITGASGNSTDYEPYLQAIGAAEEQDHIFAANCYCPIHNLENADTAYEWLFHKEQTAHMMRFEKGPDGKVSRIPVDIPLSEKQMKLSLELKEAFPEYLNSLGLKAEDGSDLTLASDGSGNFRDLVLSYVAASAEKELADHASLTRHPAHRVPGSEVENTDALTIQDGQVTAVDFDRFVQKITRMKPVPAFDALNLKSPENEEFGTEEVFANHFTELAHKYSEAGGKLADPEVVKLLNPLNYIGQADTCQHWRIRHGSFDRDTSLAIPVILATMLKNKGYQVDFFLPWGLPHSGDYDLPELFQWIDGLCR